MEKNDKELGCCGYDELAEKPPTTEPFRIGKMKTENVWKNNEAGITRRINAAMGSGILPTLNLNPLRGGTPAFAYRPPSWRPAKVLASSVRHPEMGQAAGVAAFGAFTALMLTALAAGVAVVGYSTGQREKGFMSILGYGIGTLGGLAAVGTLLGGIAWIAGVNMVSNVIQNQQNQPMVQGGPEAPLLTPPSMPQTMTQLV